MSLGFKNAGFECVFAADHDSSAVETYRANVGNEVVKAEISEFTELPAADVIIGGPPCQGFSSAGMRKNGDHRNSLVSCFAKLVAKYRPKAFVFENVEGFLTAEGGKRVFELLTPLVDAGYRIHFRKINAANFGVPQHRKRVIAIGGLGWDPTFPDFTHTAYGAPGAKLASRHLPLSPTLCQALHDLPAPSTSTPGVPQGHWYKPLDGKDLERAMALSQGQSMRDLPEELQHPSFRRRALRRVMDGTPSENRGGPPSGVKRLVGEEPSKAITSAANTEFLHPFENRPLTIRECARLQTFPDEFVFTGNVAEQIQLIGNAVPPKLAVQIAKSIAHDLNVATRTTDSGALLSFVPTLSSGFSPALRKVTDLVNSTFFAPAETQGELWSDSMPLSKMQENILTKALTGGGSELAVPLDHGAALYLVAVTAADLGLTAHFPELPKSIPPFFGKEPLTNLRIDGVAFRPLYERLVRVCRDADSYFFCLATLHKARLKYERILKVQSVPVIDQVGPRGLLQFGSLSPRALAGFLFWRKWMFDIDNRAAQETGYVFEPILAHSIGGVPFGPTRSPIKRRKDGKGRQVDCIREHDRLAYEFKLRVTIAASGQGRWGEEIDFPGDCKESGYTPVLIVLDPTRNPKLTELANAFQAAGGEAHVGPKAWEHLHAAAGNTMSTFLERYVHTPIDALLKEAPTELPDMLLQVVGGEFRVSIDGELLSVQREGNGDAIPPEADTLPEDVDEELPG